MSPSRRETLHLLGAGALSLAGCAGAPDHTTSPAPSAPVLDLGESYESPAGATVTVRNVRVERLIRSTSVGSPTHVDVAWLADHQFAVVDADVTAPDGTPARSVAWLALDVDGTRYPTDEQHWYRAHPPGSRDYPGLPAFPAPVADADEAGVVWLRGGDPAARWPLPPEAVGRLGAAPSFAVRSLSVPDPVRRGRTFEATVTVANTGSRDGRFVAEFGAGAISDHGEVTLSVPAGTERTHTERLDPYYVEDADDLAVVLDWGRDRLRRRVAVTG